MLTPPGSLNGSTVTLEGLGAALNAAGAHGLVVELLVDELLPLFLCQSCEHHKTSFVKGENENQLEPSSRGDRWFWLFWLGAAVILYVLKAHCPCSHSEGVARGPE
jgi:hypothetical protein